MRELRLYDPDYYCEVTLRTNAGNFGFDLNNVDLRDQIYGLFAEAVERYQMEVFAFHFMSNHYHGLYGYKSPAQLVAFLAFLHGNLARLAHRTNGTLGKFWSPLKVHAVATDAESVGRRMRYIIGQAVAAQLVDHPGAFPGPSSVDAMLYGTRLMGRRLDVSQRCRDAARLAGGAKPDEAYERWIELPLAVPQCWADLTAEERRSLYLGIAAEIAGAAARAPDLGRSPRECLSPEIPGALDGAETEEAGTGRDLLTDLPAPPPKQEVPTRRAEDGGTYSQGAVKPKQWDGRRKRSRPPRLLAADQALAEAYDERYKGAVEDYYAAKQEWRANSACCDGSVRGGGIAVPRWMLLGTLPLRLPGDRWAGVAQKTPPG